MEFNKAISIVRSVLSRIGTDIKSEEYDGFIVKKLEASNTLDAGRSTNQTHIAITGEQMDFFPYVKADAYFEAQYSEKDDNLKKYYIAQLPVYLHKENIKYLDSHSSIFDVDKKLVYVSVVRSRRNDSADQIQLSMTNVDSPEFVDCRKIIHTKDYIVILKYRQKLIYDFYAVKENDGLSLNSINNQFYKISTNTPVYLDKIFDVGKKNKDSLNFYDFKKKRAKGGFNKIYYGAPGCGKSHYVSQLLKEYEVNDENVFRVTFHPEYLNTDFIGQILPSVTEETDAVTGQKKETVRYQFIPGPFTLALQRAYQTTDMVYLIIEEINRGNAAAIFGDLFQLLDREKDIDSIDFSSSEYSIRNVNIQDYLVKAGDCEVIVEVVQKGIYIPGNLTILATMNSSDQNVFTLDTAFKRRWMFEQISNDIVKDNNHPYKHWFIPGTNVTWETFLTRLNDEILSYKIYNQTNEDKRLGKYFVTKDCLTENVENINDVRDIAENFAYKILEYVWNDVCRIGREDWFDLSKYRTLEELIEAFVRPENDRSPLDIFRNIHF